MKVILLQNVKGTGMKGDIKDLNDGYVRNFLLPKNLVVVATPDVVKKNTEEKRVKEEQHKKQIAILEKEANEIRAVKLIFRVKTGEKGELFGSITDRDIERAFHEKGFAHIAIKEKHALKSVGEHRVNVNLGNGITSEFLVILEPQEG